MEAIGTGRSSAKITGLIRSSLLAGKYAFGKYLPPTRELAARYGVSPETIRRALKILEQEQLLESVPRHGFRVAGGTSASVETRPVAYLTDFANDLSNAQPVNWAVSQALQTAAGARGWTVLGAHAAGRDTDLLSEKLMAARVWGIVLDSVDKRVLEQVSNTGFPVVMTNSWFEKVNVDAVVQDNYLGGFQAASSLVEDGTERLAWVGPVGQYSASRERFAGVIAGLAASGRSLDSEMLIDTSVSGSGQRLRKLFSRNKKNRPDGVCAFWKGAAEELKKTADDLGLAIGTDLRVMGWAVEEFWENEHASTYQGTELPPAVVWSATDMVEAALDRLDARRRSLASKSVRINVPTIIRRK
jgi:DNA-binding LacI/PurR family transcriptional regulator